MKKFLNDQSGAAVIGLVLFGLLSAGAGIGAYHASPLVKKIADKAIVNAGHEPVVVNDGVQKR